MHKNEARTVEIARKEFPTLEPAVVEAAVKRMLADNVYPTSVDITPEALKLALETQIALGNLAAPARLQDLRSKSLYRKSAISTN